MAAQGCALGAAPINVNEINNMRKVKSVSAPGIMFTVVCISVYFHCGLVCIICVLYLCREREETCTAGMS